jgi:hypothetical protein
MNKVMSKCIFYVLLPILILLSLAIAIIGEVLYLPFIPIVLYLHKHNEEFKYFWNRELNMEDCAGKVYMCDFVLAGSYLGLFFALNLAGVLFGIGIPFHNGH